MKAKDEGCLYYIRELTEEDGSFRLLSRAKASVDKDLIHAVVDGDVDIKMYLHRLTRVGTDILVTMNRQTTRECLSFEDIARSLTVKEWSLFK